jgi:hypothetical protein
LKSVIAVTLAVIAAAPKSLLCTQSDCERCHAVRSMV